MRIIVSAGERADLALIAALYAIDNRAPRGREGDAERQQLRARESRCVLAWIQAWCVGVACTPSSGLAKAIEYMSRRWSKATLFLEHPDVPLDNNGAERAIRDPVIVGKITAAHAPVAGLPPSIR